jgi:hypothetical protein
MAATFMLAAGSITPTGTSVNVDPYRAGLRLAELLQWQVEEQRTLPLFADIIIWLENHGYMVDLISGDVQRLEPLQAYIDYSEHTAEYEDYMEDVTWMRGGC